jgi:tetratricopeptide (TPR) repeat protein
MKLSTLQIRQLIAEVFSEASLQEQVPLKQLAEGLDIFQQAIEQGKPFKCIDEINWNGNLYGKEPYLEFMASFQKRYFQKLTEEIITSVKEAPKQDKYNGFLQWYNSYADAITSWKEYVYHTLCDTVFAFTDDQQKEVGQLKQLNKSILESDWLETYPFFEKLAADDRLTTAHHCYFNLILAEIIIYWKPAEDAFSFIEKAKKLHPESEDILITLGKYYAGKLEYEKGREVLFTAASRNRNKSDVYYSIGDTYKSEQQYEEARKWYEKAIETNFLNSSVYAKFLSLQGQGANKEEIENLLHTVQIIEKEDPASLILYTAYRDASFQFSLAGKKEEAISYSRKAIDLKPTLQLAKLDLAYEYFKNDNKADAVNITKEITAADTSNYSAWWALSYFYETSGDIDKAVEAYKRCMEIRPGEKAVIYDLIGSMYKKAGKWNEALENFQAAFAEKPLVSYLENQKSVHESLGDDSRVVSLTNDLVVHPSAVDQYNYYNQLGIYFYNKKIYGEAITYYQKAIELRNADPVLYENMGLAYEYAGKFEHAEKAYQQAIELEKENGRYYNRMGVFYYSHAFSVPDAEEKERFLNYSIDFYLKANEKEPDNTTYMANIALAYEKRQLFNEAVTWYEKVLMYNEKDSTVLSGAGYCSYMAGNYDKAIINFTKAIHLEPWNVFYYDHLGYVYELQKNYTTAIETYRGALTAITNYKERIGEKSLIADRFHNLIGTLLYNSGEYGQVKESVDEYRRAIELNNSVSVYHLNLAQSYTFLGEYNHAIESCKTAIQINPDDPNAHNNLGVAYYRILQLPASIKAYKRAIELNGNNALYYDNIGLSYFEEKMYKEAEEYWLRAFELEPGNNYYLKNLQQLYGVTKQTEKLLALDK